MPKVIGQITLEWVLEQARDGFLQIYVDGDRTIVYTWKLGYLRLEPDGQLVSYITLENYPDVETS